MSIAHNWAFKNDMAKGRFFNLKLGKRTSRKASLQKARLATQRTRLPRESGRAHKKGASRGNIPGGS